MKLTEQTVYVPVVITPHKMKTSFKLYGADTWVEPQTAYVLTRDQLEQFGRELLERAAKSAKIGYLSCGDPQTCGCQGACEYPAAHIKKQSITGVLPEFLNQTL